MPADEGLSTILRYNRPGEITPHVVIALPSFGLGETTLSHYVARIPALEHRFLNGMLSLGRIARAEMIFLCCRHPGAEILESYFALLPDDARGRFTLVEVPDLSPRSLAEKILDRPDILDRVRAMVGPRPAFIEPWNVTPAEVEVARRIGVPLNGTAPEVWSLGYKSGCRKMFQRVGIPCPRGIEDVRSLDEVKAAIDAIRRHAPHARAVVVKHDNSGSGDGNAVIELGPASAVERQLATLPAWYVNDLAAGGIVEELIAGEDFSSPSAQVDILPSGEVIVLSTHEQLLGGPGNQVYQGCAFPADAAYAADLARHAALVGADLAEKGALGRFSIDFVTARSDGGDWRVYALEVNLRKGGTTHPFAALRNLVPGCYHPESGRWDTADGETRVYRSTDNLVDPAWTSLPPAAVIEAIGRAGMAFDPGRRTGIVPHMLSCLEIDGRFGLTAIARTGDEAEAMESALIDKLPRRAR